MDLVANYRKKQLQRQFRRDCADIVFFYSQFTLQDAEALPVGDIRTLLAAARLRHAEWRLEELNIQAAVQSEKGYKRMANQLEGVIKQLEQQL